MENIIQTKENELQIITEQNNQSLNDIDSDYLNQI